MISIGIDYTLTKSLNFIKDWENWHADTLNQENLRIDDFLDLHIKMTPLTNPAVYWKTDEICSFNFNGDVNFKFWATKVMNTVYVENQEGTKSIEGHSCTANIPKKVSEAADFAVQLQCDEIEEESYFSQNGSWLLQPNYHRDDCPDYSKVFNDLKIGIVGENIASNAVCDPPSFACDGPNTIWPESDCQPGSKIGLSKVLLSESGQESLDHFSRQSLNNFDPNNFAGNDVQGKEITYFQFYKQLLSIKLTSFCVQELYIKN